MSETFKLKNGSIFVLVEAPGGIYNSMQLKKIADLCDNEVAIAKATEDQRLGLFIQESEIQSVTDELEACGLGLKHYQSSGAGAVTCLGEMCDQHEQDALGTAMELSEALQNISCQSNLKIGINGCAQCCTPCHTLDIAVIGEPSGYRISLGGKNSQIPEFAAFMAEAVPANKVVGLIGAVAEIFAKEADPGENLHELIERRGVSSFITALAPYSQDAQGSEPFSDLPTEEPLDELASEELTADPANNSASAKDELEDDLADSVSNEISDELDEIDDELLSQVESEDELDDSLLDDSAISEEKEVGKAPEEAKFSAASESDDLDDEIAINDEPLDTELEELSAQDNKETDTLDDIAVEQELAPVELDDVAIDDIALDATDAEIPIDDAGTEVSTLEDLEDEAASDLNSEGLDHVKELPTNDDESILEDEDLEDEITDFTDSEKPEAEVNLEDDLEIDDVDTESLDATEEGNPEVIDESEATLDSDESTDGEDYQEDSIESKIIAGIDEEEALMAGAEDHDENEEDRTSTLELLETEESEANPEEVESISLDHEASESKKSDTDETDLEELEVDDLDIDEDHDLALEEIDEEISSVTEDELTPAPQNKLANSSEFKFCGIEFENANVQLTFESGAYVDIDTSSIRDSKAFSIAGQNFIITPVHDGLVIEIDGVRLFYPEPKMSAAS